MTMFELIEAARARLDDFGGSRASSLWQTDDGTCLWSNADLVGHANEALREFYRRAPIKFDGGPVGEVTVTAGAKEFDLPAPVLTLDRIEWRPADAERPRVLDKTHRFEADRRCLWNIGILRYWANDQAPRRPWLLGAAESDGTLLLFGSRLPDALPDWHPAIASAYALPVPHERAGALLHWIESLALLKRDSDAFNVGGSERAAARFTAEVGPPIDAAAELSRLQSAGRNWRPRAQYF